MIGYLFISIGNSAYWSFPQVAERNTPRVMDAIYLCAAYNINICKEKERSCQNIPGAKKVKRDRLQHGLLQQGLTIKSQIM